MLVSKRTKKNRQYENEFQVEREQQENPKHREKLETLKESVEKMKIKGQ